MKMTDPDQHGRASFCGDAAQRSVRRFTEHMSDSERVVYQSRINQDLAKLIRAGRIVK